MLVHTILNVLTNRMGRPLGSHLKGGCMVEWTNTGPN
jgi:hypothetical protein